MAQIHVVHMARGLTSATVRCPLCAYAFVAVNDCHAGISIGTRRWLGFGDDGVEHILPDTHADPMPKSA